jgi:hypothetical protein
VYVGGSPIASILLLRQIANLPHFCFIITDLPTLHYRAWLLEAIPAFPALV